jgi:hypothetical protein
MVFKDRESVLSRVSRNCQSGPRATCTCTHSLISSIQLLMSTVKHQQQLLGRGHRCHSHEDGTITKVECVYLCVLPLVCSSDRFCCTQAFPSSSVRTVKAKVERVFPSPISSASTPPPISSGRIGDLVLVILWMYLRGLATHAPSKLQS